MNHIVMQPLENSKLMQKPMMSTILEFQMDQLQLCTSTVHSAWATWPGVTVSWLCTGGSPHRHGDTLGWVSLCREGCPVSRTGFSSILALYHLGACSTPSPLHCDNPKYLQTLTSWGWSPPLRTHSLWIEICCLGYAGRGLLLNRRCCIYSVTNQPVTQLCHLEPSTSLSLAGCSLLRLMSYQLWALFREQIGAIKTGISPL